MLSRLGIRGWLLQCFHAIFGDKTPRPTKQERADIHRKKGVLFFTHATHKKNTKEIQEKNAFSPPSHISHQEALFHQNDPSLVADRKSNTPGSVKRKLRMMNRLRSRWLQ